MLIGAFVCVFSNSVSQALADLSPDDSDSLAFRFRAGWCMQSAKTQVVVHADELVRLVGVQATSEIYDAGHAAGKRIAHVRQSYHSALDRHR